jgi:hypothetical protein
MGGEGNRIGSAAGPMAPAQAGGPIGELVGQFVDKCAKCLGCLKDKLCSACTGGLKDCDEKAQAAEEHGEPAWRAALAFLGGSGQGPRVAMGADA